MVALYKKSIKMYQNVRKLETIIRMYHAIRQNIRR